jgi:hypothetical protein
MLADIGERSTVLVDNMMSELQIKEKLKDFRERKERWPEGSEQRIMLAGYCLALQWVLAEKKIYTK